MNSLKLEGITRSFDLPGPEGAQNKLGMKPNTTGEFAQSESKSSVGIDNNITFSDILKKSVETANEYQHQADTAINQMVSGKTKNIHETMLALERADVSLKLVMQVRNKILDAYREIMRMQV